MDGAMSKRLVKLRMVSGLAVVRLTGLKGPAICLEHADGAGP